MSARSSGFWNERPSICAALLVALCLLGGAACGHQKDKDRGCTAGTCPPAALSAPQVTEVLSRAVAEASSLGVFDATIAVTDRENNVLAVFQMFDPADPPANPNDITYRQTTIRSDRAPPVVGGLEGITVPNALAAISKAGTASFMSSSGAAFTTRTANQITQENFNPGEPGRAGGPLFGIQLSQLPCSDFNRREGQPGLQRLPLGFTTDPGGVPLYLGNVAVGGVGVEFNGFVTNDRDVFDVDTQLEERIAVAAAGPFSAPNERTARRVALDGRSLRFVDDDEVGNPPAVLLTAAGELVPVPGFFSDDTAVQAGRPYRDTTAGSGFLPVDIQFATRLPEEPSAQFDVLTLDGMTNQFEPTDSGFPTVANGGLSTVEVMTILQQTLLLAGEVRAQVRRPLGEAARVSVTVVDAAGTILGFARNRDALLFGPDVSVQKARTAAFFSGAGAATALQTSTDPIGNAATPGPGIAALAVNGIANYVTDTQGFLDDPSDAFTGTRGYSTTSIGAIARPFFPNGINGNVPGPLSRPFPLWSQFMTGLQLEVSLPGIAIALCPLVRDLRVVLSELDPTVDPDDPATCPAAPATCTDIAGIANGLQIFSGGVPIYRGSLLVGGMGISGDGAEQDDLLAFLGLVRASQALGGAIGNAPRALRSDQVTVGGKNLRYVRCPVDPFLGRNEQNACEDN